MVDLFVYAHCVFYCINQINCIFQFAFIVCILCRVLLSAFVRLLHTSVCVCVFFFFFCVVFNQQMNIVKFHLHNWGAVVTSSCELLRISEQQVDNELILKHTWRHISWKKED